jgi:hypothetical protein
MWGRIDTWVAEQFEAYADLAIVGSAALIMLEVTWWNGSRLVATPRSRRWRATPQGGCQMGVPAGWELRRNRLIPQRQF